MYHPDFAGGTPYIFRDGRTEKRLGFYRKLPCGRIEDFDVQNELTFCQITEVQVPGGFTEGSILEAVPVGQIEHLLRGDGVDGNQSTERLRNKDVIQASLDASIQSGIPTRTFVLSVYNVDQMVADRGTAFVNRILASLYNAIEARIPNRLNISELGASEFVFVCPIEDEIGDALEDEIGDAEIEEIIEEEKNRYSRIPDIRAGVYDGRDNGERFWGSGKGEIDEREAIELSRLALNSSRSTNEPVVHFSERSIMILLNQLRNNRNFEEVERIYNYFRDTGIRNAWLENGMALALDAQGNSGESIPFLALGIEIDPDNTTLHANIGVMHFRVNERTKAHRAFLESGIGNGETYYSDVFWVPAALSAVAMNAEVPGSVDRERMVKLLKRAKESEVGSESMLIEIERGLVELGEASLRSNR